MTTLGLLVGNALAELGPGPDDAIVYASGYAESRALEGFLDSFPTPSPTLFQTSIHPSAVQQLMIGRQAPVREFLPLSGGARFAFHALRAALLSPAPRVLLCGGEERGTWLLERGLASARTFAFAAALSREAAPGAVGRVRLSRAGGDGELGLESLVRPPGWQDPVRRAGRPRVANGARMAVGQAAGQARRNPGPSWGYRFMRLADRALPEALFRPLRRAGTWVAVAAMPRERRCSREYLRAVLGREASIARGVPALLRRLRGADASAAGGERPAPPVRPRGRRRTISARGSSRSGPCSSAPSTSATRTSPASCWPARSTGASTSCACASATPTTPTPSRLALRGQAAVRLGERAGRAPLCA